MHAEAMTFHTGSFQGRNEVYGIRDRRPVKGWVQGSQAGIWDHSTWDRDQQRFHGQSGIRLSLVIIQIIKCAFTGNFRAFLLF